MGEIQSQKVVVITGCSSGIGLETAIACAKEGHKVFATMRNLNKKEKLEKRIKDEKLENIEISELDVSDADSIVNEIAKIARKIKKIDVLFNNAGFMVLGSLEDSTINEIREQINTDLMGPIHVTKQALPHMQSGDEPGLIINMSSIAGRIGFGLTTSYCTSKFGIEGFSESLRGEILTKNVNVALIEAGITHTDFFKNTKRTLQSYNSNYSKDTQMMEDLIKIIENEPVWTTPQMIAEIIVKEVIPKNGEKFRYVIGNDAQFLLDGIYNCKDDIKCIDKMINTIMNDYLTSGKK